MSAKLKGVIFGITDVILTEGALDVEMFEEIARLIKFVTKKGLVPVFFSNTYWSFYYSNGEKISVDSYINEKCGEQKWFIANRDDLPKKPTADSIKYVLDEMGWEQNEAIYIGNTKQDMRVAVNGGVLFVNVTWFGPKVKYGFQFAKPSEVARFIDIFCLKEHFFYYSLAHLGLDYYSLVPYSTRTEKVFSFYSNDARNTAKFDSGTPVFWMNYLISSIYFSGLYKDIDWITPYPSHLKGAGNGIMDEYLDIFAKCFRKTKYIPDLIVRFREARKSATDRSNACHKNQLTTIKLERLPKMGPTGKRYKRQPNLCEKTVLVIDDFCTKGYSLEAARQYLIQAGARVICLSWLKTVNRGYYALTQIPKFDPFQPNLSFPDNSIYGQEYSYETGIVDHLAPFETDAKLRAFLNWDWPD